MGNEDKISDKNVEEEEAYKEEEDEEYKNLDFWVTLNEEEGMQEQSIMSVLNPL